MQAVTKEVAFAFLGFVVPAVLTAPTTKAEQSDDSVGSAFFVYNIRVNICINVTQRRTWVRAVPAKKLASVPLKSQTVLASRIKRGRCMRCSLDEKETRRLKCKVACRTDAPAASF